MTVRLSRWLTAVLIAMTAGCGSGSGAGEPVSVPAPSKPAADAQPTQPATAAETEAPPDVAAQDPTPPGAATPAPAWLGTRPLPLRPDGFGQVLATPPELADRRVRSVDLLPPPDGEAFTASVVAVPDDVLGRSTWSAECPVGRDDLRYVTVAFWGFDELPHTGELLVHRVVADDVVEVFRRLHEARFPIEEMRITRADELDLHPTGDGNNTGAFVCRPSRGSNRWSQHAFGRAIDVNPFHNPYVRGDLVLPELASSYVDRQDDRPGMIHAGDEVTRAFGAIGWGWGGDWRTVKDWMHFSVDGT